MNRLDSLYTELFNIDKSLSIQGRLTNGRFKQIQKERKLKSLIEIENNIVTL